MTAALTHRGPDAEGFWSDPDHGLALGHRRLAVVELGPEGAQPMCSPDGRWVLDYNGEIYNHGALRRRLAAGGVAFRGGSDTEVLVAAVQEWGLEPALEACEGMFALALWDRHRRELHLVRDRFGEKPLYYGWVGDRLAFASELKSLVPAPGVPGRHRPRRGGPVPAPQLRPRAAHHLPRRGQAAARAPASPSAPTTRPGDRPADPGLLVGPRGGRGRPCADPLEGTARGHGRPAGVGPVRLGGGPHGGRRAGRCLPVRRGGLERGGGA